MSGVQAEKKQGVKAPKMEAVSSAKPKKVKGPPLGGTLDGFGPGQGPRGPEGLPATCPVTPIGTSGARYYFLDALGQLIEMKVNDFSQNGHFSLFGGDYQYLCWGWPSWSNVGTKKEPEFEVVNYKSQIVSADLMAACHKKGVWRMQDKRRGRGGWAGKDGRLILHCGDMIWDRGRFHPPGMIDGDVYPALGELDKPWPVVDSKSRLHPGKLLELFQTWRWKRPELDPQLLLGGVCVGYLGAALKWRTNLYLYGDKGCGKSTLQELISTAMGGWRFLTTNTTAAGIYQYIQYDSIAIAVDEMEGKADNRVGRAVMELARQSSSGGTMARGGSEGVGTTFEARSAFMFSSINPPPMEASDLSRVGLLRLEPFREGDREPVIDDEEVAIIGRMILRALVDGFERFREKKTEYDVLLREQGHDGRGCATFGTLLALQEIVLGERAGDYGVTIENRDHWEHLVEQKYMAEYEDILPNWRKCLNHLLTAPVDQWRSGGKISVGDEIHRFFKTPANEQKPYELNNDLGHAGVKIMKLRNGAPGWWLAVPSDDPMLAKLFAGSTWAGGWKNALQQGDEGGLWVSKRVTINGSKRACTLISLNALYDVDGLMSDRGEEE